MYCKICNSEFDKFHTLVCHLKSVHKLKSKEYYDKYLKRENEDICHNPDCNNKTHYINISTGYRQFCSVKCQMLDSNKKLQRENTCLKNYGVKNPSQSSIIKEKKVNTFIKHCGYSSNFADPINRKKQEETRRMKHNGNYHSEEACKKFGKNFNREKIKVTNIKNHGFENPFQWPEVKEKIANKIQKHLAGSKAEFEIYSWICEFYNGNIIAHDRSILKGRELDIYLPELKIAFEYDGRYWHADPNIYKETDLIENTLAKDIWERDAKKDTLCLSLGITLIRIKENDYLQNKDNMLSFIKNIILERLNV